MAGPDSVKGVFLPTLVASITAAGTVSNCHFRRRGRGEQSPSLERVSTAPTRDLVV
jgi:hypothetical protein